MPVILKEKKDESIVSVADMQDGQIGVIVQWGLDNRRSMYIGRVVQKYGAHLVSVGMSNGNSWVGASSFEDCYRVRLLKKGEILEIEQ